MTDSTDDLPTYADLAADPAIAALLEFEPVPRQNTRADGWSPELQRRFIAWLAYYGSPGKACDALGKRRSGIDKLYKVAAAESFRTAWAAAVELNQERRAAQIEAEHAGLADARPPFVDNRRKHPHSAAALDAAGQARREGQVMNELGEWEDEDSFLARADDARANICTKLLRIRRLYLKEIGACPGKRAAFEILTELPIDWGAAERGEPQPDEPWRPPNQHQPDMILLAESGWPFGHLGYGRDRQAEARRAIDDYRAEQGLDPIDWDSPSPLEGWGEAADR